MKKISCISLYLILFFLCSAGFRPSCSLAARPKKLLKIATIAPEGSIWLNRFKEFDQKVREDTGNTVGFKIYPGGVMGDDKAMFRKIKIGQLQGGGLTVTGMSEIVPDFRVMSLPFLFKDYSEVDRVLEGLTESLQQSFEDRELVLLAITEVGFVYTMSTVPVVAAEDLKNAKCWIPEGDPLSKTFLQQAGASPIQLTVTDVLTSLQTGLINTVFNGYYGSIVLQWFTKIKYVSSVPFGYAYGAFVLDRKAFQSLPVAAQKSIVESARDILGNRLKADTRKSNREAREILAANKIETIAVGEDAMQKFLIFRDRTIELEKGRSFSQDIFDKTMLYLNKSKKVQ